jgi:uncharacterized protein (DUF1330 family)
MKKILALIIVIALTAGSFTACESGPSDEEKMAQQIDAAMKEYQAYAAAYVQQQQAQQQLDELTEKARVLQTKLNAQNLVVLNSNQMAHALKTYKDPLYNAEIKRNEDAAKAAAAIVDEIQPQLDDIRAQIDIYQKSVDEAAKVINEMKARSDAAAQANAQTAK